MTGLDGSKQTFLYVKITFGFPSLTTAFINGKSRRDYGKGLGGWRATALEWRDLHGSLKPEWTPAPWVSYSLAGSVLSGTQEW